MTTERSALGGRRVLLGVTGGIAAYKACILVRLFHLRGASVRVVMTRSAERFVGPATFAALSDHRVYTDLWEEPGVVPHVRLAHEADVAVVAPVTANVIAKLAQGIADDLLAQVDSKYTLVTLSAKRAREINSYYNQLGEGRAEFVPPLVETGLRNKPLSIALEEIAEGKINSERPDGVGIK